MSADSQFRLLAERRFLPFFGTQALGAFNDNVYKNALVILAAYHAALGELVFRYEGTLEHFAGDGMLVFFNDPVPCDDAPDRAVRMALEMRSAVDGLAVEDLPDLPHQLL